MSEQFFVVPEAKHNALIDKAYRHRGYNAEEAALAAKFSSYASWHGIRTHNAIKALHLDHLFGSGAGGCKPNVKIEKKPTRFAASEIWNANRKLGQATAYEAMDRCIELADKYGIGQVSVDNAFHYLWGGGYVMYAAKKGYIAYTNCTAALAEVVPFGGSKPTLGTNPHSWGFPTQDAIGFPIVVDWATSVMAMGRVQQLVRENKPLPPDAAVDKNGKPTLVASEAVALMPFGAHKGYSLSLINEIVGAFIGGSLPTLRSRWPKGGEGKEKHTPAFYFQAIHPDAWSADFAMGRSRTQNIKAVIDDVLSDGNSKCLLPGQLEAQAAQRCEKNGGLLFSAAEVEALNEIARECGAEVMDLKSLKAAS